MKERKVAPQECRRIFEEITGYDVAGKGNALVRCPFPDHNDKNPSFGIDFEKNGAYMCFGCGRKGNIITFVKEMTGQTFDEYIGETEHPVVQAPRHKEKEKAPILIEDQTLLDWYAEEKQLPRDYLEREWHITELDKHRFVMPYFDEHGKLKNKKIRTDQSEREDGTQFPKFYYASDSPDKKYLWYGMHKLRNPKDDFYVTVVEGESDTQTMWFYGINTVGIAGATTINRSLLAKLLKYKLVYFWIEPDKGGEALRQRVEELTNPEEQIKIRFIHGGEYKDASEMHQIAPDFVAEFEFLQRNAEPLVPFFFYDKKKKIPNVPAIAYDIVARYHVVAEVRSQEGAALYYRYDKTSGTYKPDAEQVIEKSLRLDFGMTKITQVNEVKTYIKSVLYEEIIIDPLPLHYIPCANGVLDIDTMEIIPFSPALFVKRKIATKWNPDATSELIPKLLQDWIDAPNILVELAGYTLWRAYPNPKIFFLYGAGANGKSTYLSLLIRMLDGDITERKIASGNISYVQLHDLITHRFAKAELFEKLLNIGGETNYDSLENTAIIKDITGETPIAAEKKNADIFYFQNFAKIVFAMNDLPPTRDKTHGFYRRIFILQFKTLAVKDPHLKEKITQEDIEYLFRISVEALKKLRSNGWIFDSEMDVDDVRMLYEKLTSPVAQFFEENITEGFPEDFIAKREILQRCNNWLRKMGRREINNNILTEEFRELGYEAQKNIKESGKYGYYGLRWRIVRPNKTIKPVDPETEIEDDDIPF